MADKALADEVRAALAGISIPGGGMLDTYQGLSEIIVTENAVAFAIAVQPGMEAAFGPVRDAAVQKINEIAPAKKALVSLTGDRPQGQGQSADASTPPPGAGGMPGRNPGPPPKEAVKGIRHIITVASGKGGVGKSTTAVNLALALAATGKRVGILDADIYGPSLPKLMGIEGKPAMREDGIFQPHEAHGLKIMSIGSMLEGDQAVVWRGPMATSALRQLLRETDWGELDILVVDLPPGTGDVHISICQQVPLTGAVVVSTPQDLALIDARKAVDMFARLQIPILGLIENMSTFVCPHCGETTDIFGHGGAERTAPEIGAPFLGAVPLHMDIRLTSDAGTPVMVSAPDGPHAEAYRHIASGVLAHPAFT
ncbi:Mrp/NBP35 family ATP-binding protein [Cucumibacter marinus]|uniref:Mrp/NBP35 family ATP-binding protein n=1 Tax=Cucumibacter marinus TaxID=1121252 RepID=UPI00041A28E2|nr:Mrp/NBP35 family ATP-binding protein [Cucumibacter marinus]